MAAAYLFHIIKKNPFVDENKRTGVSVAPLFLKIIPIAEINCEKNAVRYGSTSSPRTVYIKQKTPVRPEPFEGPQESLVEGYERKLISRIGINNVKVGLLEGEPYSLEMKVANSKMSKSEIANFLRQKHKQ
jgi:hypothetical protein